jgi:PTS system fructose-specific IIA component/PTS system nitrogen regulatory IIA component
VDRLLGTVAVSPRGVPFDSLDGEPVHLFVLLISPQDRPGDHLRALENVSRCLRDDNFVRALREAGSREKIWALLEGGGNHQPA